MLKKLINYIRTLYISHYAKHCVETYVSDKDGIIPDINGGKNEKRKKQN